MSKLVALVLPAALAASIVTAVPANANPTGPIHAQYDGVSYPLPNGTWSLVVPSAFVAPLRCINSVATANQWAFNIAVDPAVRFNPLGALTVIQAYYPGIIAQGCGS